MKSAGHMSRSALATASSTFKAVLLLMPEPVTPALLLRARRSESRFPCAEGPGQPTLFERCGCYWGTSEVKEEPEEIPDTAHELVLERVCAIDVAKDSWPDPEISFDSGPEGYTAAPS
jgi:hypothetical protein